MYIVSLCHVLHWQIKRLSGSVIVVASSIIIYTVKLATMHIHNNIQLGDLKKMSGGPTAARGDCVEHCGWS